MALREWTSKPCFENVARLRHAVAGYSADHGLRQRVVDDVALAVTELVSNAVLHAYRDGSEGTITVSATLEAGDLTVRVIDDGIGLTPRTDSPGAGLGLTIAGSVADHMQVEQLHRGTAVSLTFAAAA